MKIRSLKPNVTREEAIEHLNPESPARFLREMIFGPLRSVAEFYIPFRLYQVEILNGGKRENRIFGLDAVTGSLDLYHFEHLPTPGEVICLETRNCPLPILDDEQAKEFLLAKVRRLLFSTGFFRIRDLRLSAEAVPGEIHVPYWVGFRGAGAKARLAVLDAIRRRPEGAKVRHLLRNWLSSAQ